MIHAEFVLYRRCFVRIHRSFIGDGSEYNCATVQLDIMSSDGLKAMEVTGDKVNLKSFVLCF